jgi:hypothetical protein
LLRGSVLYNRKNLLIDRLTQECLQSINPVIKSEGSLSLKIVRDHFFFNNVIIQVKVDQYSILKGFLQEMRNRWIGEIELTEEIEGERNSKISFTSSRPLRKITRAITSM